MNVKYIRTSDESDAWQQAREVIGAVTRSLGEYAHFCDTRYYAHAPIGEQSLPRGFVVDGGSEFLFYKDRLVVLATFQRDAFNMTQGVIAEQLEDVLKSLDETHIIARTS